jgi:hypothetical protein
MHQKFTLNVKMVFQIKILVLLGLILGISDSNGQTPWSGVYGNEWIVFGQSYLRIPVVKKGIHALDINALPDAFKNADRSKLQLWHRGKQVSIIDAGASELLFFGIPNDGKSDELLFRPASSRLNPYYSIYSTESSYFLTIGTDNGKRAISESHLATGTSIPYHYKTDTLVYRNSSSHSTLTPPRPDLNSFFEDGKSKTGTRLAGNTIQTSNVASQPFTINLKSLLSSGEQPVVKLLVHSRNNNFPSNLQVSVKAGELSSTSVPRIVGTYANSGFMGREISFPLLTSDLSGDKTFSLSFLSSPNADSYFSIAYISVTYQQNVDMKALKSETFVLPKANSGTVSRVTISNLPAEGNVKFYDISDVDNPRIITESTSGTKGDLMITRGDADLSLYASNERFTTSAAAVSLQSLAPSSYDYLIITDPNLNSSANNYANYRKDDTPGRKYKPVVINIKDVYNQFNYGEPSPVAIRRFVDYMISDGNYDKYLLLIGKSISHVEFMKNEIPNEVPTVGFPGSDILLVDGLGQAGIVDVPSIPVGRISASTTEQLEGYLNKVKTYENQTDKSWRKNAVHISGGKYEQEVNDFAVKMEAIAGYVTNGQGFNGKVTAFKKTANAQGSYDYIQNITISNILNSSGAGMVSYFGHGSTTQTDLNSGYASNTNNGYNNTGKYPVMFYNGCGVNNIFSNLFNETSGVTGPGPNVTGTNGPRPISLDWLLAPNKGAIVVFGNTWDAYANVSNDFLQKLYPLIFGKSDLERKTIGHILRDVAIDTKKSSAYRVAEEGARIAVYNMSQANIHQMLLQGDPAIRILVSSEAVLPVDLVYFKGKLTNDNKIELSWKTSWEKNHGHFIIEKSSDAIHFEQLGLVEGKGDSNSEKIYSFIDANPGYGNNYYRLIQVDKTETNNVEDEKRVYSSIISVNRPSDNLWTLYPNPSSDFVDIKQEPLLKIVSWSLVDMNGRTVLKDQTEKKIDVSGLSTGTYIIEILSENGSLHHRKFVKK